MESATVTSLVWVSLCGCLRWPVSNGSPAEVRAFCKRQRQHFRHSSQCAVKVEQHVTAWGCILWSERQPLPLIQDGEEAIE